MEGGTGIVYPERLTHLWKITQQSATESGLTWDARPWSLPRVDSILALKVCLCHVSAKQS